MPHDRAVCLDGRGIVIASMLDDPPDGIVLSIADPGQYSQRITLDMERAGNLIKFIRGLWPNIG